jgi:hypothetical protein
MHRGHLLDWRKEVDSAIWLMPPLFYKVWKYILKRANYKDTTLPLRQGGTIDLKRGQFLTTLRDIADGISWYERNRKVVPNPNQIRRILKWMEEQEMIVIEKINLTRSSRAPNEKQGFRNNPPTLITILNYSHYQSPKEKGCNRGSNSPVTVVSQEKELKRIKNISCEKVEDLKGLLISLPEFCHLSQKTQKLIISFLDKARTSNKTKIISSRRVQTILNDLVAICGETSPQFLNTALEITIQKAEAGQFTFNKQNVTGYLRAIARNQFRQAQETRDSRYEPQETDTEALYR